MGFLEKIFLDKPISLVKAIVVPYLIVLMFFFCFGVFVWVFTVKLQAEHESLYQKAILETSSTMKLFDKLQDIQGDVYNLINEKTQLVAENELNVIKNSLSELFSAAKNEKNNEILKGYQKNIVELLKAVDVFLAEVEKYVQKRNMLIQQRFKNIQEIRYVGLYLNESVKKGITNDKIFMELIHSMLDDLLVLNSDIPMFYAIKVYKRLLFNYGQLKNYAKKNNLSADNEILHRISGMMLDENSYVTLFFELEELNNKETSLIIYLDSLSNQTVIVSTMLFDELRASAEEQNVFIKNIMGYLSYFSVLFTLAAVAFIVLVSWFLSKHILHPVGVLRTFIKERTVVSCTEGNQKIAEIRDISCAVYDFVSQIEENERKLKESHQNLEKQVLERTEEIRRLSARIINVSEEERIKLAAELHDDIGSSIGTIKFGIEHALRLLNASDMNNARESLDSSVQIVKSVARQLRRIQTDLRPPYLDIGLLKTLEMYIEDYKNTHPMIEMQADFFFDDLLLSTSMQIVTFRIIQEGLNNIAKHSRATKVSLTVQYEDCFKIVIADNGIGMADKDKNEQGNGLRNIAERVKISGGEFVVECPESGGTVLTAKWDII